MKTMKWTGWSVAVLLVASLMWTTGCGGSDGDDGTTTVVVTNANGETTTVIVTNTPAVPSAEATLAAPQLVSPENYATVHTTLPPSVLFEWTAVPGATEYVMEMNGEEYGTAVNKLGPIELLHDQEYLWRVRAENGDTLGAFSEIFMLKTFFKPLPDILNP